MKKLSFKLYLSISFIFLFSPNLQAFEYLEHSYFSDRSCILAQRLLKPLLSQVDDKVLSKYLALKLSCPNQMPKNYCENDSKNAKGYLNLNPDPEGPSITLGDYSALADHISRLGPIKNIQFTRDHGLTQELFLWLSQSSSSPGGFIEELAEKACEIGPKVSWTRIEKDIQSSLTLLQTNKKYQNFHSNQLNPVWRGQLPRGPVDHSTIYTFINPHFLDLIPRSKTHFGEDAYATWQAFHSNAISIAKKSCIQNFNLPAWVVEEISENLGFLEELEWNELSPEKLAIKGCQLMRESVKRRILFWSEKEFKNQAEFLKVWLKNIKENPTSEKVTLFLDKVVNALMALIFEGNGIHFIQDNLAGGHIRTKLNISRLAETRYDHDFDNKMGVKAQIYTRAGKSNFIAYGDSYLLSKGLGDANDCKDFKQNNKKQNAACFIQNQRGMVTAVSAASILDFTLGGTLYSNNSTTETNNCSQSNSVSNFICQFTPLRPITALAYEFKYPENKYLSHGDLPVPPPPYYYESLLFSLGLDGQAQARQIGLRLNFLREVDMRATWLYSLNFAFFSTFGKEELENFTLEFAWLYNFRWAARFLINMGLFAYNGFNQSNDEEFYFFGAGPIFGISGLPEGWTKIPLEMGLYYRLPINNFDSRYGFYGKSFRLEAHWIEFIFGLAFM